MPPNSGLFEGHLFNKEMNSSGCATRVTVIHTDNEVIDDPEYEQSVRLTAGIETSYRNDWDRCTRLRRVPVHPRPILHFAELQPYRSSSVRFRSRCDAVSLRLGGLPKGAAPPGRSPPQYKIYVRLVPLCFSMNRAAGAALVIDSFLAFENARVCP